MRILLTDQFAEIGGAQRGLLEAAAGFAERGWDLHAVLPEGPLVERLRPFCQNIATIPCGPFHSVHKTGGDALRFARQFREQAAVISRVVETERVDVLYVNGPRVLPAAAWGRSGRPVLFHSHSVVTQHSAARVSGYAMRYGQATVVASSNFVARWIQPFVRPEKLQVIYNGIEGFGRIPQPRQRFTRVGVLGRIAPEKGQLTFVRAARLAQQANPELSFLIGGAPVFAGQEYLESIQREASSCVRFTGWTDNVGEFFEQIDILVVPSDAVDANPRVIPEAFAAGVPVIAFDGGGISELIEDHVSGILVRQHTPRALAAAVLSAVQDAPALNEIVRRGHQRWRECYTLPRFQSEVCDAVERCAADREPVHKARASASA
ncbi:MAG: glycosyltransferase family 4 protein [Acidobacteriota bacterium]